MLGKTKQGCKMERRFSHSPGKGCIDEKKRRTWEVEEGKWGRGTEKEIEKTGKKEGESGNADERRGKMRTGKEQENKTGENEQEKGSACQKESRCKLGLSGSRLQPRGQKLPRGLVVRAQTTETPWDTHSLCLSPSSSFSQDGKCPALHPETTTNELKGRQEEEEEIDEERAGMKQVDAGEERERERKPR